MVLMLEYKLPALAGRPLFSFYLQSPNLAIVVTNVSAAALLPLEMIV